MLNFQRALCNDKLIQNLQQKDNFEQTLEKDIIQKKRIYKIYEDYLSSQKNEKKSIDDITCDLTNADIKIIKQRNDLFYFCTPKRILPVDWIVKAIGKLFAKNGKNYIFFVDAYDYLRKTFAIKNINRQNLKRLFNCSLDVITIEQFNSTKLRSETAISSLGVLSLNDIESKNAKCSNTVVAPSRLRPLVNSLLGLENTDGYPNKYLETDLTENERAYLKAVKEVIQEIGIEICCQTYQFPEKLLPISNALNDYYYENQEQKKRLESLVNIFLNIAEVNKNGRIIPLINAYKSDEKIRNILKLAFGHCLYIKNLEFILEQFIQEDKVYNEVSNFFKWLENDLTEILKLDLFKIFKNEQQRNILSSRANGATLEEVGQQFGLSRQRVSQIEIKIEGSFIRFFTLVRPQFIVLAFSSSDICFDISDLIKIFADNAYTFIYLLKRANIKDVRWSDELSAFIIGKNNCLWYKDLLDEVDTLPEQITNGQLENIICSIMISSAISIDTELIRRIIISQYKQTGEVFSKRRISKRDMYKIVFERYYPQGMKLFDDFEMMRFKVRLQDIFGPMSFGSEDTRAISARITDFTVLCDRGKYILPSAIQIQPELLEDIRSFILNHERFTIMFVEIFERFRLELLEKSNIQNRYFLQGMLKYYWNNEFEFSRHTISRGSVEDRSIRKHIEAFIRKRQKTVTIKELKAEFLGITDIVLNMALAGNNAIMLWGMGEYIHASLIDINENERTKLKKALDTELNDGSISSRALFDYIFSTDSSLLNENQIYNHIALFSVYQYLFLEEYAFNRPYISVYGREGTTTDTIIDDYISSFNTFSITDLKAYLENKYIRIMNFSALLDNNCSEFLRAEEDLMIRVTDLDINEDIINDIEERVISVIGDKGYMAAKKFTEFFFFPFIGTQWTPYLLVSFIKKYCKKLATSQYALDYRYLNEIIVRKSLGLNNHAELIRYALKFENNNVTFTTIEEAEFFLKEEGLIANTIPSSLYECGYVSIQEGQQIKII